MEDSTINGILNGSRCIVGAAVVRTEIGNNMSEDNIVALVGRIHIGRLAIMGNSFIPPLGWIARAEGRA
jgi:hypothetical protein